MHKSSRIKNKINELKKHIVLSEEEFISYCDKQKDIHLYPSYITNSRLLNNFYEKYPKAVSLRFEGEGFYKINKEKLEILIRNDYFKFYGKTEIPGQVIKNIKDKKTYDYLISIYKEEYSNDDILESSEKELYFLKIKKNSLKMRVLNNGGLDHFNFYYGADKIFLDQYLYFIYHCNDVSKINKMLQTTSNYIEEIIPLLDVSFYENLVRKNIALSSLDLNFLFFAKNKEVIDYLMSNGLVIDKNNILSIKQIQSLRKISFNANMIHNILYLNEVGCILDPEIKENKNNVVYKILSSRKSCPDDVLKILKHLKYLNWNLKYEAPKKRIPRTDVIHFPWLKNKEIIDYVIDNDFISKEIVFKKADFRNNYALIMYMIREYSQIMVSDSCLDHIIDILSSNLVSSEARWKLVNEIENANYKKTILNCFISNAGLFKDIDIREKWRFLKYIIKNKDDINSLKPLFFKCGITENMYNYILENTGFDVNSINGEGENILFYIRSKKMANYFLNKGVDSTLKNNKKEACFLNYYEKTDIVNTFSNKETFIMDDEIQAVFINKILSSDFSMEEKNRLIEFYDNKQVFSFIKNANSLTVALLFDNNIEKEHIKYLEEFLQVKEKLKKVVRIIAFMNKCYYYKDDTVVENHISDINTGMYKEGFLENNPELRELFDSKFFHTVYNLINKKSVALKPLLKVVLSLYGDSLFQSIKEKDYFFEGFRKEYIDWFNNILLEMQSHSEFEKIKNKLNYVESEVNKKKRM